MRSVLAYAVVFGAPFVIYYFWVRFLSAKLGFLFLLPVIVCGVWLALWPVSYLPVWRSALEKPGDVADPVVIGFLATGWIYGIVGCLPVIVIDAIRSFLAWRASKAISSGGLAEPTDG